MQKGCKYKSPEAEAREKRHQFGQPEANKQGHAMAAVNMREFYRWVESIATQEELKEYVKDKTNPYVRRKFVQAMTAASTPQDFFDLTNQTHGSPKQVIETVDAPTIIIDLTECESEMPPVPIEIKTKNEDDKD